MPVPKLNPHPQITLNSGTTSSESSWIVQIHGSAQAQTEPSNPFNITMIFFAKTSTKILQFEHIFLEKNEVTISQQRGTNKKSLQPLGNYPEKLFFRA